MTITSIAAQNGAEDSNLCCVVLNSGHSHSITIDRSQTRPEEGGLYLVEGRAACAALRRFCNGRFRPGPADMGLPRRSIRDGRRQVTGRVTVVWSTRGL